MPSGKECGKKRFEVEVIRAQPGPTVFNKKIRARRWKEALPTNKGSRQSYGSIPFSMSFLASLVVFQDCAHVQSSKHIREKKSRLNAKQVIHAKVCILLPSLMKKEIDIHPSLFLSFRRTILKVQNKKRTYSLPLHPQAFANLMAK